MQDILIFALSLSKFQRAKEVLLKEKTMINEYFKEQAKSEIPCMFLF